MAVSQCPKCKAYLIDYKWAKTRSNKNWLKHPQKGWHSCANNDFKKRNRFEEEERYYRNPYKYDPFSGDIEAAARFRDKYNKATIWCDNCSDAYYLTYPCIHHLTDSKRDQIRFAEWKRENKTRREKEQTVPDHKQKGL